MRRILRVVYERVKTFIVGYEAAVAGAAPGTPVAPSQGEAAFVELLFIHQVRN